MVETHITPKEALPIVLACAVWGEEWNNKKIHVYCDNEAAAISLNAGSSKDTWTMHLIRCLFFIKANFGLSTAVQHPSTAGERLGDHPTGLDLGQLGAIIQQLFSAGIADSTRNTYRDGLAGSTAKTYLSGVRFAQISLGGKDPDIGGMPHLEYVLMGFRKLAVGKPRPRLPITPPILRKMWGIWSRVPERWDASMLWAASCMCFFGFLRSGEIVVPSDGAYDPSAHLSYGDVRTDSLVNPSYITVAIKASKTDPFRKGVTVHIGATKSQLCPVAAVLAYMVQRGRITSRTFLSI
eukprot:Em0013g338a